MDLFPGDIVQFHNAGAGKHKYHLCILEILDDGAAVFMYLNSKDGFAADFILSNDDIPFLPPSETGKSVISCSQLHRANARQLKIFQAKTLGKLDTKIAKKLIDFVQKTDALPKKDKEIVIKGLKRMLNA